MESTPNYQAMYESERARADNLSTQVNDLERSLASNDRALRSFFHDSRGDLGTIMNLVELTQMELRSTDDPNVSNLTLEGASYLPQITERTKRLVDMSQQYLDIKRMERGTYVLQPRKLDLIHTIREVGEEVAKKEKKNVRIIYHAVESHIAEDFSLFKGDKNLLRACIRNLMDNAYQAALDKTDVYVLLNSDKNNLYIEISNKGTIPVELRDPEKLFAFGTTSGKAKGNGIGTYSARLFARAHGGEITFETSDKKNSTIFKIELPKTKDDED